MKKLLKMMCSTGLIAGVLIAAGCGSGGGDAQSNTNAVAVSGAGTVSAAAADISYTFQPGTYTYDISGFTAGDKLAFPAGAAATVDNPNWSDGVVSVQWASSSNVITVKLTGLTTAQDSALNSVDKINLQFGTGTVR